MALPAVCCWLLQALTAKVTSYLVARMSSAPSTMELRWLTTAVYERPRKLCGSRIGVRFVISYGGAQLGSLCQFHTKFMVI